MRSACSSVGYCCGRHGFAAAQERAQVREQFARRERAHQVVVGAEFEREDLVHLVAGVGDDHQWAVEALAQLREPMGRVGAERVAVDDHDLRAQRAAGACDVDEPRGLAQGKAVLHQAARLLGEGFRARGDQDRATRAGIRRGRRTEKSGERRGERRERRGPVGRCASACERGRWMGRAAEGGRGTDDSHA